ncbi:hypothetical protein G4B88_009798 [Cannabis sativa]|uniref:Uncharacterized protein n=1 Tax=Cannabis sativa TaxID=3483 RepID=A0A7J6E2T7_CANSA|nr:hypothetical protein G4B88_009798 [Cannabis sativa]
MAMGRQAMTTKSPREFEFEAKGPFSKAKSKSLKFASQEMKKAVTPPKFMELSLRGSNRNKSTIGRKQMSLFIPFETILLIT